MAENIYDDKNIERETDPELVHGEDKVEDLDEEVGDTLEGTSRKNFLETGTGDHPGDMGATGDVGLEELATEERLKEESGEERERRKNLSDMQDEGDPEAGDVGISGGLAAGETEFYEDNK